MSEQRMIAANPAILDAITFVPLPADREHAHAGTVERFDAGGQSPVHVGDVELDEANRRRQACIPGGPWIPMRSLAKARAYIVAQSRPNGARMYCWRAKAEARA